MTQSMWPKSARFGLATVCDMIKAITLLLIFMAVLAMFGRLRFRRLGRDKGRMERCKRCGRPKIGSSGCDCKS